MLQRPGTSPNIIGFLWRVALLSCRAEPKFERRLSGISASQKLTTGSSSLTVKWYKSFHSCHTLPPNRESTTQCIDCHPVFLIIFKNHTCHLNERKEKLMSVWENIFHFVKCVKKITVMAKMGNSTKAMLKMPCHQNLERINSLWKKEERPHVVNVGILLWDDKWGL